MQRPRRGCSVLDCVLIGVVAPRTFEGSQIEPQPLAKVRLKQTRHPGLGGNPCIPSEAIESAFNAAARTRRKGKQAKAGLCCFVSSWLQHDGPSDLSSLWADKAFVFRSPVNVNGSKVMRTRPRFNNWHVIVNVVFIPSLLNRSEVLEFFEIAGFREGLGDWRPKFGKFSVKEIN